MHEKDWRPARIDIAVAPLDEGDDQRPEIHAFVGEPVFVSNRVLLVLHPREDALVDQQVEAGGQHVAGGPCPALEVFEAPGAHERVAHNQEGPAFADELERAGDRADLGFVGTPGHRQ